MGYRNDSIAVSPRYGATKLMYALYIHLKLLRFDFKQLVPITVIAHSLWKLLEDNDLL